MHLVFVGKDPQTAHLVEMALHLRWPEVQLSIAATGREGIPLIERNMPDLVVVNPDGDDLTLVDLLQETRQSTNVPMMVLSHSGDVMEAVTALDSGADEYVRLPCDLTELMLRSWALLRRSYQAHRNAEPPLTLPRLTISPETCEAFLPDRRIKLTLTEFRLLYVLVANRGRVVPHRTIEQAICQADVNGSGTVRKYIQRLRKKLGDDPRAPRWVSSVRGVGYRFLEEDSEGGTSAFHNGLLSIQPTVVD